MATHPSGHGLCHSYGKEDSVSPNEHEHGFKELRGLPEIARRVNQANAAYKTAKKIKLAVKGAKAAHDVASLFQRSSKAKPNKQLARDLKQAAAVKSQRGAISRASKKGIKGKLAIVKKALNSGTVREGFAKWAMNKGARG